MARLTELSRSSAIEKWSSALTEAGHHPELRYVEYPGVGHE